MRTNVRADTTRIWGLVAYGLSGRLLLLTSLFVLMSEILTFAPAVGRIHRTLLETHILTAELAVMPFNDSREPYPPDASQDPIEVRSLKRSMLQRADALAITVKRSDLRNYYPVGIQPGASVADTKKRQRMIDLSQHATLIDTYNGLECLLRGKGRILYATAPTHIRGAQEIGVFLDETPIRAALVGYARRLIADSLLVSILTAVLVFASLYLFLVRPMRRIIQSMADFRENPEDASRILEPSAAGGEIGQAERELAAMQKDLYGFLRQKDRLAALGTAVARIQHDLRNILTTAQLTSDRLALSEDPAVKKLTPSLVAAIDRAVNLAGNTLKFVRAEENPPVRSRFALAGLIDEAADAALGLSAAAAAPGLPPPAPLAVRFVNRIAPAATVFADRDQIFRVALNLIRNAAQACALAGGQADGTVAVSAQRHGDAWQIDIEDNGPGIPQPVRDKLFQPFAPKGRNGGTGLGLAIARELVRGHGGELILVRSSAAGTVFRIRLPDGE